MPIPEISAWRVQLLRLTAFLQLNDRAVEETWWRAALQQEPETSTARHKSGLFEDSGTFEDGLLKLSVRAGRADWLWQIKPSSVDLRTGEIPTLGTFDETWGHFRRLIAAWAASRPRTTRVAFGLIADQQVADKNAAYGLLQSYLPSVEVDPASADFMYQVNRPRPSEALPGYRINRLRKWLAMTASFVEIEQPQAIIRKDLSLIRTELDVNTFLEAQVPIPQERFLPIIDELAANARVILAQGDVP